MNISFKNKSELNMTIVPNNFIDNYIKDSNPSFVLVYLMILRYFNSDEISIEKIANNLNLLDSDVLKALEYWNSKDVILFNKNEDDNSYELEILDLHDKEDNVEEDNTSQSIILKQDKPNYTDQEIGKSLETDESVVQLFKMGERILGKLLTSRDRTILYSIYDWLGLPLEVIAILLTYCADNDKKNLRYIEAVAIDWCEKEITTEEKAYEYIRIFDNEFKEILKAFGIMNRMPTKSEQKYMNKWISKFTLELIKEACDRTAISTGQASFKYANSILEKWEKENIKSMEDVKNSDTEFNNKKEAKKEERAAKLANKENEIKSFTARPNKFVNYKQREYDPDKMRELERELLENDLKQWSGE